MVERLWELHEFEKNFVRIFWRILMVSKMHDGARKKVHTGKLSSLVYLSYLFCFAFVLVLNDKNFWKINCKNSKLLWLDERKEKNTFENYSIILRIHSKKMAGYLSCITVGGGVPMFTRRVGDLKAVSYSITFSCHFSLAI